MVALGACETLRTLPLCQLDVANDSAHCSIDGKKQPPKPLVEIDGWIAASEESWRKIGDKLQECDQRKP